MEKRKNKLLGITVAGLGLALSGQAIAANVSSTAAVRVAGIFQLDAASFSGDTKNGFDDSVQVRRAEVAFKGKFDNNWSYQVGLDLDNMTKASTGGLANAWLGYSGFPVFIAAGYLSLPAGLENWGSASATQFMERANVANYLAPSDVLGLYGEYANDNMSFAAAVGTPEVHKDNDTHKGDPLFWSARATFSPMHTDGNALHFGASYWHQDVKKGAGLGTGSAITAGPEVAVRNTPDVVGTVVRGANTVDAISDWGLEAGGIWGPLSATGEYHNYVLHGTNGTKDVDVPGYYVQVGYVLTGESRTYDQPSGTFGNVKPSCIPCGAWEVAVRYSTVDMGDRANKAGETLPTYTDVTASSSDSNPMPGEANNWTLGLNWYATNNVKFQLNYVHVNADYERAAKTAGQKDRNMNIWAARAQVKF